MDISLAKYYKWEKCWEEEYKVFNVTHVDDIALRLCTKKRLMVACIDPANPDVAKVAANAPRDDVMFHTIFNVPINEDTQPPPIIPHEANGVSWYWNTNNSFGFAPAGETVILHDCDISTNPDRMCVHFAQSYVINGYSCGSMRRGYVDNWKRLILQTDEDTNDP